MGLEGDSIDEDWSKVRREGKSRPPWAQAIPSYTDQNGERSSAKLLYQKIVSDKWAYDARDTGSPVTAGSNDINIQNACSAPWKLQPIESC